MAKHAFKTAFATFAVGDVKVLQTSGAKTSNFTTTNSASDARLWQWFTIVANVTAVSGTTPTLDLQLQWSDDDSTYHNADGVLYSNGFGGAVITATGRYVMLIKAPFGTAHRFVRVAGVIAGQSPSFTLTVDLHAFGPNEVVA